MTQRKQYCSNCNKYGHQNKNCPEPIISAGIICFKTDNIKISYNDKFININNFNYQNLSNIDKIKFYKDKIKFLLVQRKHSLNYINFMRGKYDINDLTRLSEIFSYMSKEEINNIYNNNFEYLWTELWEHTARKKIYLKEYNNSMIKFNKIKNDGHLEILYNKSSEYNSAEWEFPKGRKNINESNFECALREFNEETGINKDDIVFLNCSDSIHDNFIGTNNLSYKHIFYIGMTKQNSEYEEIKSKNEIKQIKWCTWDECLKLFRPYHTSRVNILNKVFLYIINLYEEQVKENILL